MDAGACGRERKEPFYPVALGTGGPTWCGWSGFFRSTRVALGSRRRRRERSRRSIAAGVVHLAIVTESIQIHKCINLGTKNSTYCRCIQNHTMEINTKYTQHVIMKSNRDDHEEGQRCKAVPPTVAPPLCQRTVCSSPVLSLRYLYRSFPRW